MKTLAFDAEEKAVRKSVEQFYAALNAMFTGDLGAMKEVWSHAEDVTYMGPGGGFRIGWDQILMDWEIQAAMKLGGKVKPENMHITVGQELGGRTKLREGREYQCRRQAPAGVNPGHKPVPQRGRKVENNRPSYGFTAVFEAVRVEHPEGRIMSPGVINSHFENTGIGGGGGGRSHPM